MTELFITQGRLPEASRTRELIALGATAHVADARGITLADIHAHIVDQEMQMDADVTLVLDRFESGIRRNGIPNSRILDVIQDIEVSNATWHRYQWRMQSDANETFNVNTFEANTVAQTAQITPKDLLTWLGCTPNVFAYLIEHTNRLRHHNEEMEAIGRVAARFADERQFCSEYDEIVNGIIEGFTVTNCPTFGQRERKFELMVGITMYVPIEVTAPNMDVAVDIAGDQITSAKVAESYDNGNFEVNSVERP